MTEIKLGARAVGRGHKPFIIAEMSGNHNQSIDRAFEIIDAAAACGVDAIKIQTYTAETMTLNIRRPGFVIDDPKSLWSGQSLYELYEKAHTPWDWHPALFERARKHGVPLFSTPFDETAVDFLEKLGQPFYKIASFEMNDVRLVRKVASTGKPMIISCGMATVAEIDECVRAARGAGAKDLVLLKCTSSYPATPEFTNLLTIPHMRDLFGCEVGLSDHTMGVGAAVASVALGASVIEKHFTLRRADGGVDSEFSLEPAEMRSLVVETERAWQAMGKVNYGPTKAEKNSIQFRRSLYISKPMKKGEKLSAANMRAIRPGYGLPTKYWDQLLGKAVGRDVEPGTPLDWDLIGGAP